MFSLVSVATALNSVVITITVFVIALAFHEASHAFVAYALGDSTAKSQGRLTINPLVHLDLMGTLAIIFLGFGWGKPVPVNAKNFKNQKRDMALTALAGPFMNFFIAFLGTAMIFICIKSGILTSEQIVFRENTFSLFLLKLVEINILLGVFNLIPLPPLDGGNVILGLVPDRFYSSASHFLEYHGPILFFLLLGIDMFLHIPLIQLPLQFFTQYILIFFSFIFPF